MRIYVSGPVTGREDTAPARFEAACARLGAAGHEPVNPLDECPPGTAYHDAMRADIGLVLGCDGVALLPGWHGSRGCMAEVTVASAIGIPVRPVGEWCRMARLAAADAARGALEPAT